jgi:hypothetical protein
MPSNCFKLLPKCPFNGSLALTAIESVLRVIDRPTKDVDVMHPQLPGVVADAARAFAAAERKSGVMLSDEWLNNGPQSLATILPVGWEGRLQPAFAGRAITLATLGRADLLKTKLFALSDRGTDILDCVALAPSATELDEAPSVGLPSGRQSPVARACPSNVREPSREARPWRLRRAAPRHAQMLER